MRPITGPILQQNNNNNYPCISAVGPGPQLPKCSHPALPLPSRSELGLAGLPLIRGLRAWALCSRSRQRPGGPLGLPPMSSPSCPRPADVHLSAQWGLPLGLDARHAGIGALVATLQTAEGSSRTQTQCLFLRTDRGSCLYPTAKPTALRTSPGPGGVLRGWLRSKTGGAQVPPSDTGPIKARERSGRRWRKSANNTAGQAKARTRQQRQEESHKGGSGSGQDSPQSREESIDQPGERFKEESKGKLKGEGKEEPRDQCREELRDQEELIDDYTEKLGDDHKQELKDKPKGLEARDQSREETRSQQRQDLQDQSRGELRDNSIEYPSDQSREEFNDKEARDQPTEATRDQSREETRDQSSEEPSHQPTEKTRAQSSKETRDQPTEETRDQPTEETRDQPTEETRDQSKEAMELHLEQHESLTMTKPGMESYVQGLMEENIVDLQKLKCSKTSGNTNKPESITVIPDGFCDTVESDVCSLCDPAWTLDCAHSSAPVGGSKCNTNAQEADPSAESQFSKFKSQKFAVDKDTSCPSLISNGENNIEACNHVRCEGSFTNQLFSTFTTDKQSELRKKTDQENGMEMENNFADSVCVESIKSAVSDCFHHDKVSNVIEANCTDPLVTVSPPDYPASTVTATSCYSSEETETEERWLGEHWTGHRGNRGAHPELDEPEEVEQRGPSLDPQGEDPLEDQEFGVFMQAPSSCSHERTNHKWGCSSTGGTPGSLEQLSDSWAVFPRDESDHRRDDGGQWWPHSSLDDRGPPQAATPASVFAAAFPSHPATSSCVPCDLTVPTLTQVLRGCQAPEGGCPDQGLLDTFHDLNKMIGQRYKRASGVSQELLLRTLGLETHVPGSRAAPSSAHRRLSPGLPSPGLPSPGLLPATAPPNRNMD